MSEEHNTKLVSQKICNHCDYSGNQQEASNFNYCPQCGKPTIEWQKFMQGFFYRAHFSPSLDKALTLFYKCEYESAARTSLIIIEEKFREQTKLDTYGADLFAKAFAYKLDSEGNLIEKPLIQINDLSTEEARNEHEGIKLLCMGLIKGIRNIVAHHSTEFHPKACLSILTLCALVLDLAKGGSILNKRVCVWTKVPEISTEK